MGTILSAVLPFAGCAAMSLMCARMMRRGQCRPDAGIDDDEVARLRAEVTALRRTQPDTVGGVVETDR